MIADKDKALPSSRGSRRLKKPNRSAPAFSPMTTHGRNAARPTPIFIHGDRHITTHGSFPRAAAYHEAGHAVARIYVGAPASDTRIFEDGSGYSVTSKNSWRSTNAGWGAIWDLLLVLMAGPHAEARATKRSLSTLSLSKGLVDFKMATLTVLGLVEGSGGLSEQDVWEHAARERAYFLHNSWSTITRIASVLQHAGFVSGNELNVMTAGRRLVFDTTLNRPDF